jgi:hypothetical protein
MADKRLQGFYRETIDELLAKLPPEELRKRLSAKERLEGLPAEERLKDLPAEERLKDLPAEQVIRALPPETLEVLRRQLQGNGSSASRSERWGFL